MKNYFQFQDVWFSYECEDGEVVLVEDMHGNTPNDNVWDAAKEDREKQNED